MTPEDMPETLKPPGRPVVLDESPVPFWNRPECKHQSCDVMTDESSVLPADSFNLDATAAVGSCCGNITGKSPTASDAS